MIWGFTYDLLNVTDRLTDIHIQNVYDQEKDCYYYQMPNDIKEFNNVPLTTLKQQPEEGFFLENKTTEFGVVSLTDMTKTLENMMVHTKFQLIKVNLSMLTQIYASNYVDYKILKL